MALFKDEKIGCVTGRPVSLNKKNSKFGYWSHLLADAGAHKIRKKLFKKEKFLECSGYLWAFRNHVVKNFPLDVPEDAIVPYYFMKKSYKIGYAPNAIVYVSYPKNLHDFIDQKKEEVKEEAKKEELAKEETPKKEQQVQKKAEKKKRKAKSKDEDKEQGAGDSK